MIKFKGHSDDIVYIEGDCVFHNGDEERYGDDYLNCAFAAFKLSAPALEHEYDFDDPREMVVLAHYHGEWSFSIALVDEDVPLPGWMTVVKVDGYSAALSIDAPPDTIITQFNNQIADFI